MMSGRYDGVDGEDGVMRDDTLYQKKIIK